MSEHPMVIDGVRDYYEGRLREFGPCARGVDWNSAESQAQRFDELVPEDVASVDESILDYGCGYGALLAHLRNRGWKGSYCGYDVSPAMTATARQIHGDVAEFLDVMPSTSFDRTVASGLFNVRLHFDDGVWEKYVRTTLDAMWERTRAVMAFNMLTSYSDPDRRRENLYYANPGQYLDLCIIRYSRHARLHHGYGLYEFTIQVEA
jgi:SAM-dependent methyltransferase